MSQVSAGPLPRSQIVHPSPPSAPLGGVTPEWPIGALLSLCLALWSLLLGASCTKPEQDARIFERCSEARHCAEPNVCLSLREEAGKGHCLKLCDRDSDCPKGLRCTGRHDKHAGEVETFCRKPEVDRGGDCTAPGAGCKAGLRCFKGRCMTTCGTDSQCPDPGTRCVPVLVDALTASAQEHLFSVCLPATRTRGQACSDVGPFCARGHFCYEKKCLKGCTSDKQCGRGHICDGKLYLGKGATKRARAKAKPDRLYCQKAARRGRPCHHNLHLSCRRGLTCVKFHCRKVRTVAVGRRCDPDRAVYCKRGAVCYESTCHRTCLSDDDCPRARRRRRKKTKDLECHERLVQKRKVMLCL